MSEILNSAKGRIYYETIALVIFSHVKITCYCVKAYLVFHWCLCIINYFNALTWQIEMP